MIAKPANPQRKIAAVGVTVKAVRMMNKTSENPAMQLQKAGSLDVILKERYEPETSMALIYTVQFRLKIESKKGFDSHPESLWS